MVIKKKAQKKLTEYPEIKNFDFVHTLESIGSSDEPVNALRKLKKSSMRLGINSLQNGKCDGFVSAGNTGALMAISKFVLKQLKELIDLQLQLFYLQ